ncbi:TPA: HNH endonuclease [Escherichia coli]|nr:endonuclease [Escherichia coli]HCQ0858802.1 HNH endonuclease [Escherichia coli]
MERVEEWRDVIGYEEYFQVSNKGRIFSKRTNKILALGVNKKGYSVLSTRIGGRNGVCKCFRVHILVANAFIPNPHNKPIVNHKDGNKLNNEDWNLEWSTYSDNTLHAYDNGLIISLKGTELVQSKLTEEDVRYIRSVYKPYDKNYGARILADKYGVSHTVISDIASHKSWKHVK